MVTIFHYGSSLDRLVDGLHSTQGHEPTLLSVPTRFFNASLQFNAYNRDTGAIFLNLADDEELDVFGVAVDVPDEYLVPLERLLGVAQGHVECREIVYHRGHAFWSEDSDKVPNARVYVATPGARSLYDSCHKGESPELSYLLEIVDYLKMLNVTVPYISEVIEGARLTPCAQRLVESTVRETDGDNHLVSLGGEVLNQLGLDIGGLIRVSSHGRSLYLQVGDLHMSSGIEISRQAQNYFGRGDTVSVARLN